MDDFFEKWKTDKRFQAMVKLGIYILFVLVVSIYAFSINIDTNANTNTTGEDNSTSIDKPISNDGVIKIPDNYKYKVNITIDDKEYKYTGEKKETQKTIIKDDKEYLFKDNEYYLKDNETYVKVTKEEVYDIINYSYLDLENINTYLSKATKNDDQYIVYLKDIILGEESDKYIIILLSNNDIDIDYTQLMKLFNNNVNNYKVKINIEE